MDGEVLRVCYIMGCSLDKNSDIFDAFLKERSAFLLFVKEDGSIDEVNKQKAEMHIVWAQYYFRVLTCRLNLNYAFWDGGLP